MKKAAVASIFSIVILSLCAIGIYLLATEDKEGPEIIFESESVYIEGEEEDALLANVKATDKRDGDVSESLIIESIMPVSDETQIRVVYVAKDHSNNITKISRTIDYVEAEEEDITKNTTKDSEKKEIESTKEDRIDTTDTGDTAETTESTEEDRILAGRPTIELTQSLVTITRGTGINYMNYIQSVYDDIDEEARLWGRVIIEGEPESTNTPGTYEITYQVVDSDEIKSEKKTLTLSIE